MRAILMFLTLVLGAGTSFAQEKSPRELWLYCPTNFQVTENVDKLETLWTRAAKAGYTHVLVVDSKFAKLGDVPDKLEKIERAATCAGRSPAQIKSELAAPVHDLKKIAPKHDAAACAAKCAAK